MLILWFRVMVVLLGYLPHPPENPKCLSPMFGWVCVTHWSVKGGCDAFKRMSKKFFKLYKERGFVFCLVQSLKSLSRGKWEKDRSWETDRQTDEMKIVYMVGLIAALNVSSFWSWFRCPNRYYQIRLGLRRFFKMTKKLT